MDHIIITGASRGLGKALAESCNEKNTVLHLISRNIDIGTLFPSGAIAEVHTYQVDLSDTDYDVLMKDILSKIKNPSFLGFINNAGVLDPIGPLGKVDATALARIITVNCTAPLLMINAFMRMCEHLTCERRIINITSGAAKRPYYGWSGYCASKAALNMISQVASTEQRNQFGENGVKVMAIAPGILDTDMQRSIRKQPQETFAEVGKFIEYYKANALQSPEVVAKKIKDTLFGAFFPDGDVLDVKDL